MTHNPLQQIGQHIQQLRTQQNLTIEQLAKLTNKHRTTIYRIETGKHRLSPDTLQAIAKALNTPERDIAYPPTTTAAA